MEPKWPVAAADINHHTAVGVNVKLHRVDAYPLRDGLGGSLVRPCYQVIVFLKNGCPDLKFLDIKKMESELH